MRTLWRVPKQNCKEVFDFQERRSKKTCSAKNLLPKVCHKGVANSSIKLCLASTGTPHPARQPFRTLLFNRTEKLSSVTIAKCPPGAARHELGYPQKIWARVLRTLFVFFTSSVRFLSEKPEIVHRIWFNGKSLYEKMALSTWSIWGSAHLESVWPTFPDLQLVLLGQGQLPASWEKLLSAPSFFPCLENSWGLKPLNISSLHIRSFHGIESLADSRKQVLSTSSSSHSHVNRRPPYSAPAAASGWSCRKFQEDCSAVS